MAERAQCVEWEARRVDGLARLLQGRLRQYKGEKVCRFARAKTAPALRLDNNNNKA